MTSIGYVVTKLSNMVLTDVMTLQTKVSNISDYIVEFMKNNANNFNRKTFHDSVLS